MTAHKPIEAIDNSLSEYLFALRKDGPAKTWWNADLNRAPIFRALRIDCNEEGAGYAATPFRVAKVNDRWLILAAYPAPSVFDPVADWLDIKTVIAWEPNSDTAHVLGDPEPQLVGNLSDEANVIFASPRAFFQAWAMRRAQFYARLQATKGKTWRIEAREADEVPGALLIGDLAKAPLSPSTMPEHIECHGLDPQALNRAILRAARLPRVVAAQTMKRAA